MARFGHRTVGALPSSPLPATSYWRRDVHRSRPSSVPPPIARLLDFAVITAVLVRFQSVLKPLAIRPLVLLGQASLQVFVTHFVFCFIGLGLMGSDYRLFGWTQFALIAITFASLLLVAKPFAKPDPAPTVKAQGPAPVPSPSF